MTNLRLLGLSVIAVTSVMLWPTIGTAAVHPSAAETPAPAATAPSWTLQFPPNRGPAGKMFNSLSAVSCSSATACTAVGYSGNSGGLNNTLAERWNGTGWAIQSTPNPSGLGINFLSGVSCSSATACMAVGDEDTSGGLRPLAVGWNGTKWAVQSTPNPSGATSTDLHAVSCSSATACTAVGAYSNSSGDDLTLAERWNGTKWAIQSSPNPSGAAESNLIGVSCPSATACTAVGNGSNASLTSGATLAERWNGTKWAIQSTPNPSGLGINSLAGVSCSSATACMAVGGFTSAGGGTLAERWNGTKWAIQSTPNPSGAAESNLNGVSCPSATACTAVGDYQNTSGNNVTLAEHWNGTGWAAQSTPSPDTSLSVLDGVSCSSVTACIASGYYDSGRVTLTLAARYS